MSEPKSPGQPDEATIDLLIKQVTEGLTAVEQRELDVMDSALTSVYARDFERAAAAIAVAGSLMNAEALPAALRTRVEQGAELFFAPPRGNVVDLSVARAGPRVPAREPAPVRASSSRSGWYAAAACLLLAAVGWLRSPHQTPPAEVVNVTPVTVSPVIERPAPPPPAPLKPAVERDALLADSASVKLDWTATKDPAAAGVTGDVVWDPVTQKGFIRIVGLKPNDPQATQYQLWVFDGGRDKRYPVDGGVFDVPADATEVIVPIHAALPVRMAKAFAVTVEQPGGVVVSAQKHVVLLAQSG